MHARLLVLPLCCASCSLSLPFDELDGKQTEKPPVDCRFTFEDERRFAVSGNTWDVGVADFDGDGHPDLAVTRSGADAVGRYCGPTVLLGDGEGAFESWYVATKFEIISRSIGVSDLNGDQKPDIAVSYSSVDSQNPSGVLQTDFGDGLGGMDGGGIWTVPMADDIALGDFNGDGRADAAVIGKTSDGGIADEKLHVFLGNTGGGLDEHDVYDQNRLANTLNAVAVADLNRDGMDDLIVSHWGFSELSVMLGAADGSFFVRGPYETGSVPHGVGSADFDHDGELDIVVVNNSDFTFSVLSGQGDGSFGSEKPYQITKLPTHVAVADFDGDTYADVVVSGESEIALRRGLADGGFAETQRFVFDGRPHQMAAADLNHDGLVDLAVANLMRESISVFMGGCEDPSAPSQ